MSFLSSIPDLLEAGLFSISQMAGGNLGGVIVAVSLAIRLGLLPLTLVIARRSAERGRRLAVLKP